MLLIFEADFYLVEKEFSNEKESFTREDRGRKERKLVKLHIEKTFYKTGILPATLLCNCESYLPRKSKKRFSF